GCGFPSEYDALVPSPLSGERGLAIRLITTPTRLAGLLSIHVVDPRPLEDVLLLCLSRPARALFAVNRSRRCASRRCRTSPPASTAPASTHPTSIRSNSA